MTTSPIKFGTSGWRGIIADDFTFANVGLALTAIAEHVKAKAAEPTILIGYDTRFYSEEFSQLAVDILRRHGVRTLLCETFTPTPAVARRRPRSAGSHQRYRGSCRATCREWWCSNPAPRCLELLTQREGQSPRQLFEAPRRTRSVRNAAQSKVLFPAWPPMAMPIASASSIAMAHGFSPISFSPSSTTIWSKPASGPCPPRAASRPRK